MTLYKNKCLYLLSLYSIEPIKKFLLNRNARNSLQNSTHFEWGASVTKTRVVFVIYLNIGTKGRRVLCSTKPHLMMNILSTVKTCRLMKEMFIQTRNINFDWYLPLKTKHFQGKSIKHFCGKLKELSENCDLGCQKEILIRYLLMANMQFT